jgi:hypothetical protein
MGLATLEGAAMMRRKNAECRLKNEYCRRAVVLVVCLPFFSICILHFALGNYSARADESSKAAIPERPKTTLIVVLGAPGEDKYAKIFAEELATWRRVASSSGATLHVVGDPEVADQEPAINDHERLRALLAAESSAAAGDAPLWLVLMGHGTFDGRTAAFNLRGPDVSTTELAKWLKECRRPLAVIDTTAASGPFLTALSAPGRVVVTATKSGQERNYARFGRFFAKRVVDRDADLDKDDQTSLLEAFLAAARDTAEFYKADGRIATEHPLLDDTGDGRGVRADFFVGDKPAKLAAGQAAVDGDLARKFHLFPSAAERQLTAEQVKRRDELETAVVALRRRKASIAEEEYFAELERLLVELARVYEGP